MGSGAHTDACLCVYTNKEKRQGKASLVVSVRWQALKFLLHSLQVARSDKGPDGKSLLVVLKDEWRQKQ